MRFGWFFFLRYLSPLYLRLYVRLFKDRRVPLWPKVLVIASLVYAFFPLDLLPDWFFFVGWIDDFILLIISLINLVRTSPRPVIEEHLRALRG
ncbi:MAG: DUF1232 domain-containing protein [Deltaproteobacteria bacterium]|nr:DUF1232 domain-containing protein [Deltaproteobacteria bacterium]